MGPRSESGKTEGKVACRFSVVGVRGMPRRRPWVPAFAGKTEKRVGGLSVVGWFGVSGWPAPHPAGAHIPTHLRGGCSCCTGVINTPHPSTHRGRPVTTGRGTGAGRPILHTTPWLPGFPGMSEGGCGYGIGVVWCEWVPRASVTRPWVPDRSRGRRRGRSPAGLVWWMFAGCPADAPGSRPSPGRRKKGGWPVGCGLVWWNGVAPRLTRRAPTSQRPYEVVAAAVRG